MSPSPRLLALLACLVACAPSPAAVPAPAADLPPRGPALLFSYPTLDGRELSTATLAGRVNVIGFVTTYDLASQAQARFLASLLREHTPRLNVALLVLEAPENRPLIEAFVAALKLPYPVALADAATIAGEGPFSGLHRVPSVVFLDAWGREALRNVGLMDREALEAAVRRVERLPR